VNKQINEDNTKTQKQITESQVNWTLQTYDVNMSSSLQLSSRRPSHINCAWFLQQHNMHWRITGQLAMQPELKNYWEN